MSNLLGRPTEALSERFKGKWLGEPNSGCWLWTAAYSTGRSSSHLRGWIGRGKRGDGNELAHRAAWLIYQGDIPPEMDVCHSCDVPLCVNPDHLFLGTHADNMADCFAKGRASKMLEGAKGEAHPRAKLCDADVLAIRADARTLREIAADYRICIASASAIRTLKSWKHLA